MANNLDQTGVIQVDGAWVTSVKYSAEALGPNSDPSIYASCKGEPKWGGSRFLASA